MCRLRAIATPAIPKPSLAPRRIGSQVAAAPAAQPRLFRLRAEVWDNSFREDSRKMARRILSTLTTAAIAGAIGFGAGVYATPPDKADEFRALVNSKLDEINGLTHRERAAVEPKAKAPSEAAAPPAPEAAPNESLSAVPAEPAAEPPAAEAAGPKDMPDANAALPSATPTENSESQPAPARSAQRRSRGPRHQRNAIEPRKRRRKQNPSPRRRRSPSLIRSLPSKNQSRSRNRSPRNSIPMRSPPSRPQRRSRPPNNKRASTRRSNSRRQRVEAITEISGAARSGFSDE